MEPQLTITGLLPRVGRGQFVLPPGRFLSDNHSDALLPAVRLVHSEALPVPRHLLCVYPAALRDSI